MTSLVATGARLVRYVAGVEAGAGDDRALAKIDFSDESALAFAWLVAIPVTEGTPRLHLRRTSASEPASEVLLLSKEFYARVSGGVLTYFTDADGLWLPEDEGAMATYRLPRPRFGGSRRRRGRDADRPRATIAATPRPRRPWKWVAATPRPRRGSAAGCSDAAG